MLEAIILLCVLGLIFGLGLGIASKIFHVDIDPKVSAVNEALPGANCGACGYPGCAGFADAVVRGEAPVAGCIPGGEDVASDIAEILGVEAGASNRNLAVVHCKGDCESAPLRFDYVGIRDCKAALLIGQSPKACVYGCMGLGTCVSVCPFDAMIMDEKTGLPVVNLEKCTGCGKCVVECPKKIIHLIPESNQVHVLCSNKDKGKKVKEVCSVGCIGCGICAKKACHFEAIEITDNLAVIDPVKCTNCQECVSKCPAKTIETLCESRLIAVINDTCVGCTLCAKKCPVEAITGERKELHKVDLDKCIGCGVCAVKCPKKSIEMQPKSNG